VRGRAKMKKPQPWECCSLTSFARVHAEHLDAPCAHARVNIAAAPSTSPHRAVAPCRLDVVCQRPAKGRFFLCLGAMWNHSYRVEGRG
jgi:hypothetical protein